MIVGYAKYIISPWKRVGECKEKPRKIEGGVVFENPIDVGMITM